MDRLHFPLDPNLGALEIGYLASGFFFGLLTVQTLIYNRKFAKTDPWAVKLLVTSIWILELGQLGCVAHAAYYMTITNSGNPLAILHPPQTIGTSFLLATTVGPLVEAFYVSRLLRFSGKIYPALIGWILAFARFGGWVFLSYHVIAMRSLTAFVDQFGWLFAMLLGFSALSDLTISAWIAYFLARRRTKNVHNESARQLLDRVILWTLQTGVITSLSFLVTLICYLLLGEYLIWMAVSAIVTKVSSNCFLASLNARGSTRRRDQSNSAGPGQHSRTHRSEVRPPGMRTTQSGIGNIVDLYNGSDPESRGGGGGHVASHGIGRSAFSPDGTMISATSTRSGYWAL